MARVAATAHGKSRQERYAVADGAKHAALHLDHVQRRRVVAGIGGAAAIRQQQAFEAAIVGVPHRRVDADIGGDAGQDDVADAARAQDQFQVGGVEAAFAGLVDDDFAGQRGEFGNDLPARFAAGQDAAARAGIADAGTDLARAPALVGRQVGQVGTMAFPCMDDRIAASAAAPTAPREIGPIGARVSDRS